MIKRLSILALTVTMSIAANGADNSSNEDIRNFLQEFPAIKQKGISVSNVEHQKKYKDYDIFKATLSQHGSDKDTYIYKSGDVITFEAFDLKTKTALVNSFKNDKIAEGMLEFSKEDKNIIHLKREGNKETLYIAVDPNCPYCKDEMLVLNETLKSKDVAILTAALPLAHSSYSKLSLLIEDIKSKKTTNQEKIKLLQKYVSNRPGQRKPNTLIMNEVINNSMKYRTIESKLRNPERPFSFVVKNH